MKLSLNRIILFGLDVDKLKWFYVDHFQCAVIEEIQSEWIVLNAGQSELALHKIGKAYQAEANGVFEAESNTKLVFQIDSGLETFRKNLLNKGVKMGEVKSFAGINSLFCDGQDPEGNVFQLEERRG